MIFGDLTFENLADEIRLVRDEKLLAYANHIGAGIAKHLPPTGLRFQFHLMDIPEANAYNIPGGHVLLSRKLIAFSNNEDELAGVIAHELGHAVVRHGATDMSEALRKVLNVTSLGDRRDIVEKYNLLIERARTKSISRRRSHEDEQQLEADRIGLYAMVAAGYDPSAFTSAFARLTESKVERGGWFSDLFGSAPPAQKRVREMLRATERLPPTCREGRSAKATEEFLKWQADVVSFPGGKRLQKFAIGGREVKRTGNPDYVIVKPLLGARMGVFDVKRGTVAFGAEQGGRDDVEQPDGLRGAGRQATAPRSKLQREGAEEMTQRVGSPSPPPTTTWTASSCAARCGSS